MKIGKTYVNMQYAIIGGCIIRNVCSCGARWFGLTRLSNGPCHLRVNVWPVSIWRAK